MNNNHSYGFGWYLKETDKAITRYVDKTLKDQGLTRFHWQVMNRAYLDGVAIKENLYAKNYVSPSEMDNILDSFVQRNWIELRENPDHLETEIYLTKKGREEFETIAEIIKETGMRMFQVITQEEYEQTVNVLTRLMNHLNELSSS
ncbi:MarR family winged helix-turn-helix transcriptional regulator [Brevibacillus ruminantium]|uniref:MarR family winged helix-turn-helix transcriptional regulator n=1 Tax=Brevibacillus ruminantium TaxID=2950604 RepID=A0ABY4WLY2_9BACL|nr:MarR family winged helix-turn-helix transcriptional regulator [Brevibacillus ruminantium]USG68165.1 MarR family winged helix-turn-helix transcriptional regulator [Brevibacillus ruminantium]